jgi:hypothetical protein
MSEKKSKIKLAKVQRGLKTGRLKTGNLNSHRVEPKRRGLGESPYSVFESYIEVFHRTVKGGGGGGPARGSFFGLITVSSDGPTNGDICLQGGQVTAGGRTEIIADYLLFDASAGTSGSWVGDDTDLLQMEISGEALIEDGVIIPGFLLDEGGVAISVVNNDSFADDTLPTIDTPSAKCHVYLGRFTESGFIPAYAGNIRVGYCIDRFDVTRF